jgi:hypothetical protein
MKKSIFAIYLLFISSLFFSQDYKLCDTNVSYFQHSDKFVKNKLSISAILNGGDFVYENPVCYYKPNTLCYQDYSFIGRKVIHLQNNDYKLLNINGDTILLRPTLPVGSSWICFQTSPSNQIEATIVSEDTMSILGQLDSVKIIHFQYFLNGVPSDNQLNNENLTISKNFGIVSSLCFYQFPYNISRFNLIGRKNPDIGFSPHTAEEVFDYTINDVLRYERNIISEAQTSSYIYNNSLFNRRVINRTETPGYITYMFYQVMFQETIDPDWWNSYSISGNTISITYNLEQYNDSLFERFPNTLTTGALVTNRYDNPYNGFVTRTERYLEYPSTGCYVDELDFAYYEKVSAEYMKGRGKTRESEVVDGMDFAHSYYYKNLQFTEIDQDENPENDFDNVCNAFQNALEQNVEISYSAQNSTLRMINSGQAQINTINLYCEWYLDGEPYEITQFDEFLSITAEGNYTVKVFTSFCEFELPNIGYVVSTLSSKENSNETAIKLYPNLATDLITIETKEIYSNLKVRDFTGKIVWRENLNSFKTQIDISKFAKGIYFVEILENEKIIKVIKITKN